MTHAIPPVVERLLNAPDDHARDTAWPAFLEQYSRLLLQVAREVSRSHDAAMDSYTFILDGLRHDNCRRLRRFAADGKGKFTTWLVVVSRRLGLDFHRQRYGRVRPGAHNESDDTRSARRRLFELTAVGVDVSTLPAEDESDPDRTIRALELSNALDAAVQQLAPADRLLLKLRFDDELSGAEIAAFLHLPSPFHVYRRLNHVLEALRRELVKGGIRSSLP